MSDKDYFEHYFKFYPDLLSYFIRYIAREMWLLVSGESLMWVKTKQILNIQYLSR